MNKAQESALAAYQDAYNKAVKKNKSKLMQVTFGKHQLEDLEVFARGEKVEVSGGLDFEANEPGITAFIKQRGDHWSSPFFFEEDYEMQFHTHVAYRLDKNTASCHPSPSDMGNVSLFYPGVILWEDQKGNVQWILLTSYLPNFISIIGLEKVYNRAQGNGGNATRSFVDKWRAALNKKGLDFRVIEPGKTKVHVEKDTNPNDAKPTRSENKIIPHPTKAEINALVKSYALKIYSIKWKAPFNIQQKFHDAYEKKMEKLQEKYPGITMNDSKSMEAISQMAKKWWESQAMHGPGKDW